MSKRKSQMFGGEIVFLDILVVIVAVTYWYITGHYVPSILGVVFLSIYLYADELYFVALIMGIITILSMIFFIFYNTASEEIAISQVTITALYMLVIFLKSKSIFNAD